MVGLVLAVPQQAAAYPCGDGQARLSPDECRGPESLRRDSDSRRETRSDMRGLAIFVLAVAGAALIPIGRSGRRPDGDQARKSEIS